MDSKNTAEPSERKEKVVYELAADGTCEFEDGETIRVSRTMLAFHSKYFMEAFFGPEPKTQVKIKGFDRSSFKIFLDCLFGMKEYTILDALLIYPIAHQYEVKESLDKCTAVLEPKHLSENVSQVLNLTTFYKRNELSEYVINFIKTKYGVINFLENEKYCSLLEPSAIIKLIENTDMNSLVWVLVYQWAERYLKQRNKTDIRSFLVQNGIFGKISLAHFESAKALINFHLKTNKELLYPNEILCHLETNTLGKTKKLPDKSCWVKINKGYSFSETVVLKPSFFAVTKNGRNNFVIFITPNKILVEPENLSAVLKVRARYFFREVATMSGSRGLISNVWRRDFNFFYQEKFESSNVNYVFSPFCPSAEFHTDLNFGNDFGRPCRLLVSSPVKGFEIHSVEVMYSFDFQCRALKTSLNTDKILTEEDKLYFTRDVLVTQLEKEE